MKDSDNILDQLNVLKDTLEKVEQMATPLAKNMQKLVEQAKGEDKEKLNQFVKESNELVQNTDMDFVTKLIKLNELKAKYGKGSSNK